MSKTKDRPILFSGDMVRALLDDSKTQTRRVAKTEITMGRDSILAPHRGQKHAPVFLLPEHAADAVACCPYGQPGDRLWVRETWQGPLLKEFEIDADADWHLPSHIHQYQNPAHCVYAADGGPAPEYTDLDDNMRNDWRPSIHMFRWASRITLEITSVSVERLQDISEADALAEGSLDWAAKQNTPVRDLPEARLVYRQLWEQINGPGSWDVNPWVWVVSFKKVTP